MATRGGKNGAAWRSCYAVRGRHGKHGRAIGAVVPAGAGPSRVPWTIPGLGWYRGAHAPATPPLSASDRRDVLLPDIDGVEVLRRLRRVDPDIAIIIMTAFGTVKMAMRALDEGAFDYVRKPFAIEAVRSPVLIEGESGTGKELLARRPFTSTARGAAAPSWR